MGVAIMLPALYLISLHIFKTSYGDDLWIDVPVFISINWTVAWFLIFRAERHSKSKSTQMLKNNAASSEGVNFKILCEIEKLKKRVELLEIRSSRLKEAEAANKNLMSFPKRMTRALFNYIYLLSLASLV